ncbi:hypothetical protein RRG08_020796 [Elysia crispata]|uniref:Uncharacterized protein n=1 Tax=Elysia crispata TaxID=231223 RepID=A0AAE0ZUK7_9GAST|nr:hypothetical protein RRG08_020796 [Elysia crispata]
MQYQPFSIPQCSTRVYRCEDGPPGQIYLSYVNSKQAGSTDARRFTPTLSLIHLTSDSPTRCGPVTQDKDVLPDRDIDRRWRMASPPVSFMHRVNVCVASCTTADVMRGERCAPTHTYTHTQTQIYAHTYKCTLRDISTPKDIDLDCDWTKPSAQTKESRGFRKQLR